MNRVQHYVLRHWRGEQSILWAFWVNLVAVRAVVLIFEQFTHPPFLDRSIMAIVLTLIYIAVFQLAVFGWQAMGLVRACDRFLAARRPYTTVVAVQSGLVLSLLVTAIFVAGAFQALFADPALMIINQRQKMPPLLNTYTLTLNEDQTRVHLKGDLRIGITREFKELLDSYPSISGITLSSNGGRVTEGRGLARLIGAHGLNTYVFETCKSACTTAFIGGARRTLGVNGKLGFHQFSLKGKQKIPYIDPAAEQKIDLAFFTRQKIDSGFLDKVFQAPSDEIWFPDADVLLAAGVIHNFETE